MTRAGPSAFIARVLRAAVRARRDRQTTRRLDEIFADDANRREQLEAAALADDALADERW